MTIELVSIEDQKLPLGIPILVFYEGGADFIIFFEMEWRYCYSGKEIDPESLSIITHWIDPKKINR